MTPEQVLSTREPEEEPTPFETTTGRSHAGHVRIEDPQRSRRDFISIDELEL